mmetsp:Transcript_20332/g.30856  ORF Transcript_20332/g.30856 Transcript_20332/m.30856 type:complete len:1480 (+) Transcript_20332:113-4552(+)
MIDEVKLKKLHELLLEEEDENIQATGVEASAKTNANVGPFDDAFRTFGVLPPKSDASEESQPKVWTRTITSSLFSIPVCSPPLTTIVPLNSLSKHLREKYISKLGDGEDALVEVPIAALISVDGAESKKETSESTPATSQLPSHRPLAGNLSSKLVEYTRGQVGKRNPFKPGGMSGNDADEYGIKSLDGEEKNSSATEEDYPPYCSPEEMKNAIDVLKKGSLAAWKDGTILTAPPGASYEIGLSLNDVHDGIDYIEKGHDAKVNDSDINALSDEEDGEASGTNTQNDNRPSSNNIIVSKMWDKSYFDDDSLFGDASSSSSSGSDDEVSSSDDESDQENDDSEPTDVPSTASDSRQDEDVKDNDDEDHDEDDDDDNIDNIDDMDAFITELTQSTTASKVEHSIKTSKKKSAAVNIHNPLHLADQRQPDKDRKSWAVTALLNLKDFHSVVPNPAITYPFELDGFQKQAVARLERKECIFVAAHTSAGKTVCAEYAIALARKHCTRAIYTSPIKALSNQKYRDFQDTFGNDVGLITGDLQINADSSCLIMTTEILRSMLYRGADLIRDIEWVIFDECHYLNDSERGVVWEEVIIMLPDYVNMIFLSATTPNSQEFSDWIGRTKKKPVHVIKTDYRPVPLSHHLYAGRKMHKIMEGKSGFLEKGYKEAGLYMLPASERAKLEKGGKKNGPGGKGSQTGTKQKQTTQSSRGGARGGPSWQQSGTRQDWTALVKYLEREELMPTVVFSFSKRKCEEIANMLRTLDLNTAAEKNTAHAFANQTMKRLSPKDASLPQVVTTCEMVKRGIGVHHGGLLPILKEMVEILFSRNLIKVLFATETFAMGVNMPARAVVFNSIRKHDGTKFRVLEPGEYTQMAGRAGRRSLDKVGTVIMCCFGDEPPPVFILRNMLTGSSTKLSSQFRLTYNMILNLLRVEDMTVEGMIKRSFSEFATQRALTTNEYPKLLKRGTKVLALLDKEFVEDAHLRVGADDITDYYSASTDLLSLNKQAITYMLDAAGNTAGGALAPGRILIVTSARKKGFARAPAIVVKSPVLASSSSTTSKPTICIVLLPSSYVNTVDEKKPVTKEFHLNYVGSLMSRNYIYAEIEGDEILFVSSQKHKIDSDKLYKEEQSVRGGGGGRGIQTRNNSSSFFSGKSVARKIDNFGFGGMKPRGTTDEFGRGATSIEDQSVDKVISYLIEAEQLESNQALPPLELRDCMKNSQQGDDVLRFGTLCNRISTVLFEVQSYKSHFHPNLDKHYKTVEKRETLRGTLSALKHLLSNESLQLFPDFLQRKSLLKTLNYVDENDTVKVKGRVACECNTCEELIVTEMVFEGVLNELEPAEIVATLSALVFQEKSDNELDSELPARLREACESMKKIALNLGQLQNDHGLIIEPTDYCNNSLKFGLVHVVYEWALGVPFSTICQLTLVQEGSIVRTIVRLDELCREVRNCARVVGNPVLYRKMEDASVAIKRDIVFASSLYVT